MSEKIKVLILVMTYPLPSLKYGELVCTAGMREDGSLIRLYPVDFRYLPYDKWYRKYQWIEVEVERHDDDNRAESYRPLCETIKVLGEPINTKNGWAMRKQIVFKYNPVSMEVLRDRQKNENISLGIVRPRKVIDFIIEPNEETWKLEWEAEMRQIKLLVPKTSHSRKSHLNLAISFVVLTLDAKVIS